MKASLVSVSSVALFSSLKAAAAEAPGFVGVQFSKRYGKSISDSSLAKGNLVKRSSGTDEVELINESVFYAIDMEIGTPKQSVTVLVDTGSSDFWVPSSTNPYCESKSATSTIASSDLIDCTTYGTFSVSDSSSFVYNNTDFQTQYADGSSATGFWGHDVVDFGGQELSDISIAVADQTDSSFGVLGIGLTGLESTYSGSAAASSSTGRYQYDNFPIRLVQENVIQANAYSLYLDPATGSSGTILFGGVDHNKYSGDLNTIPLINTLEANGYTSPIKLQVTLNGLGVSDGSSTSTVTTTQIPALLDSGTTLTYLPTAMFDLLAEQIGATYSSTSNGYVLSCANVDEDSMIVYDFGGFQIQTPLAGSLYQLSDDQCELAIGSTSSSYATLGDLFLTHAYVVYDLDNKEISMAQINYNATTEDIEIISDSVPGATKAAGYYNTWTTSESITAGGNIFTLTNGVAKAIETAVPDVSYQTSSTTTVSSYNDASVTTSPTSSTTTVTSSSETPSSDTTSSSTSSTTTVTLSSSAYSSPISSVTTVTLSSDASSSFFTSDVVTKVNVTSSQNSSSVPTVLASATLSSIAPSSSLTSDIVTKVSSTSSQTSSSSIATVLASANGAAQFGASHLLAPLFIFISSIIF
ncbi:hypothetical protein KAFR_0E03940 [Kazachstania africana CBS 2517]|uniref:Peptidase A1 domain-containing protein n=1 Tax=Kazachstania africana (strain ATCC 22294 / BCRC 22015 / CBS 2517 / CECT 1963 / NBRC 1671 / NRRL Y-8276) TaxID=1071382 RepID=H2AVZ5_KAZAF|nr:hypothetical protein KAFR_0E03940 [Kazachstania africana CBS 2517]CCF58545.1 hypothetical protein KAFR_0E03940 [Kazachstania africana CBS 2517]